MASRPLRGILAAMLIADGSRLLAAAALEEEPVCEGAVCQDLSSRASAMMQAKSLNSYMSHIADLDRLTGVPLMEQFERQQEREGAKLAAREKRDAKEKEEKALMKAFAKEQEREEAELERRNKTVAANTSTSANTSASEKAGNLNNASEPAEAAPLAPANERQAESSTTTSTTSTTTTTTTTSTTTTTTTTSTNATCVTREDALASAVGFSTSDPGTPCVFGVDERDEGYHCIQENGEYGSYGWCWTSKAGTSWGSCSEHCPLFGWAKTLHDQIEKTIGDQIEKLDNVVDELKKRLPPLNP